MLIVFSGRTTSSAFSVRKVVSLCGDDVKCVRPKDVLRQIVHSPQRRSDNDKAEMT